jgi:hypothetical protein
VKLRSDEIADAGRCTIRLTDLEGRILMEINRSEPHDGNLVIDLNRFATGLYMLQVTAEDKGMLLSQKMLRID